MEILEGEELQRLLLQRYSRNPEGWSFVISAAPRDGFFDAKLAGPDGSWRLKLDTIYKPSPLVLGARADLDPGWRSPIQFGFRRVDPRRASSILDGSPEGMADLMAFLGSSRPVAPTGPGRFIQGPFVYTGCAPDSSSMSREERTVDGRLSEEMQRLVRRRYPSYL